MRHCGSCGNYQNDPTWTKCGTCGDPRPVAGTQVILKQVVPLAIDDAHEEGTHLECHGIGWSSVEGRIIAIVSDGVGSPMAVLRVKDTQMLEEQRATMDDANKDVVESRKLKGEAETARDMALESYKLLEVDMARIQKRSGELMEKLEECGGLRTRLEGDIGKIRKSIGDKQMQDILAEAE